MFLGQGDIRVFPATRRTFESAVSRQVTEANLVDMINKLIDNDGFVVTQLEGELQDNTEFSFNIHGYYFTTTLGAVTAGFSQDVYATITIDTANVPPEFYELDGLDVNNVYEGVEFTDSPQTGTDVHCLHILTKVDSTWTVPEESKVKFSKDSLGIDLIDGGVI